jgi:energy-coupling factor transporter ATP-binding protein EcfA2
MAKTGEDLENKIRSFNIGSTGVTAIKSAKRVLVIGETGAGKTTWINGIANILYGVQWTDDFRFKAVTEDDETGAGSENRQIYSQTDFVTCYNFVWEPGFPCDFHLMLVDTPGFTDTPRNDQIISQVKSLFEGNGQLGLDHLDAIALVLPSSGVRLTTVQRLIFDKILSIFPFDAVENLMIVATFADGGESFVAHALQASDIEFGNLMKFNNSVLFAPNSAGDSLAGLYWTMSEKGYQEFLTAL